MRTAAKVTRTWLIYFDMGFSIFILICRAVETFVICHVSPPICHNYFHWKLLSLGSSNFGTGTRSSKEIKKNKNNVILNETEKIFNYLLHCNQETRTALSLKLHWYKAFMVINRHILSYCGFLLFFKLFSKIDFTLLVVSIVHTNRNIILK